MRETASRYVHEEMFTGSPRGETQLGFVTGRHSFVPSRQGVQMTARWMSIREAAKLVGYGEVSFRRLIERHARKGTDGTIASSIDGVRARKLGRTWRVQLGEGWLAGGGA